VDGQRLKNGQQLADYLNWLFPSPQRREQDRAAKPFVESAECGTRDFAATEPRA
jgi:hypothetical protein